MSKAAKKKPTLQTIPADFDGRAITGADLFALIQREGVLHRYEVMTSDGLDALGKAATTLRHRHRETIRLGWTPEEAHSDDLQRKAYDALRVLAEALPAIRDEINSAPLLSGFDDSTDNPWRDENLRQIAALEAQVKESLKYSALIPRQELMARAAPKMVRYTPAWGVSLPPSVRGKTWWHKFVVPLADEVCRAVQATNPKIRIGNSDDGPLPRFLVAVIPHISNETPTTVAVRNRLQELGWENPT